MTLWEILGLKKRVREPKEEPEDPFVTETYRGTGGVSMRWNKDGKKYEAPTSTSSSGAAAKDADDDFSPDDVFVNPDRRTIDTPVDNDASDATADPDIPMTQPGTAGGGVRSRVGSMLRAKPKTFNSPVGPTASRN